MIRVSTEMSPYGVQYCFMIRLSLHKYHPYGALEDRRGVSAEAP